MQKKALAGIDKHFTLYCINVTELIILLRIHMFLNIMVIYLSFSLFTGDSLIVIILDNKCEGQRLFSLFVFLLHFSGIIQ